MNVLERIFNFIVGAGTIDMANVLSDTSPYYLVIKENAKLLTKDLSSEQKAKLENLYINQITDYEKSIDNYKSKIVEIRKKFA